MITLVGKEVNSYELHVKVNNPYPHEDTSSYDNVEDLKAEISKVVKDPNEEYLSAFCITELEFKDVEETEDGDFICHSLK